MRYFDRTFFKFLFGLLCLITIGIGAMAYARTYL